MKNKDTILIRSLHDKIFPSYRHELEKEVSGSKSLLDIGCGRNSPVRHFSNQLHCVGVDVFGPAIEESKREGIHDEYHNMNVLEIGKTFGQESFDCVLASDLIEHLTREDGLALISMMERIARRKIIIFTPQGFLPQHEYGANPWQEHKSGWETQEMEALGYKVRGINGLKWVWDIEWLWRKLEGANIFVRILRKLLVDSTQLFARNHPERAFQIMCVKIKSKD
jgi:predicted SAM-dependent methyltransferase